MRHILLMLVLLAGGCEQGHPPRRQPPGANAAATAPTPAPPATVASPSANNEDAVPARTAVPNPAVADLSQAQRRAYELGYADCSHGRYAPANHLEAYRIGCAAAHDH